VSAASKKVIYAALVGNSLIAVIKFIASAMTGSSAMLSEGSHSLVDTGNQVLLLLGIKRSQRPAEPRFPYGHGKEVYFWSFVVAILIFAVGAGISIYEGIKHLLHPRTLEDPTMFVVLFEDSAAMLGLLATFAGILLSQLTGLAQFDAIASIIIGLILGGTAVWLAIETQSLLIGESAGRDVVEGIRRLAGEWEHKGAGYICGKMYPAPLFLLFPVQRCKCSCTL
jgi:divalent metal cation (Fe/Co/Zn/Cd) transporter